MPGPTSFDVAQIRTDSTGYGATFLALVGAYTADEVDTIEAALTSAIAGKQAALGYTAANDANVVHKTSNEVISGNKSFTGSILGTSANFSGTFTVVDPVNPYNATTKNYVDNLLTLKANQSTTYTKSEVDSKISNLNEAYHVDFIDSGSHNFSVPSDVIIQNVYLNNIPVYGEDWSQTGTTISVSNAQTGDKVTLTGGNFVLNDLTIYASKADVEVLKTGGTEEEREISFVANNVGFINTSGIYTAIPGNQFRATDFIPIDSDSKLRLKYKSFNNIAPVTYYSSADESDFISKQGISDASDIQDIVDLEYPIGALYYRLSYANLNNFDLFKVAYVAKEAVKLSLPNDLVEYKTKFKKLDNTTGQTNGYLGLDGTFFSNSQWRTSDFIPFDINKIYSVVSPLNNNSIAYVYFYDESYNFIGYQNNTGELDGYIRINNNAFYTAKFVKTCSDFAGNNLTEIYQVDYFNKQDLFYADAIILPVYGQSNALGYSANPPITNFCSYPDNLFNKDSFPLIENYPIENNSNMAFAETSMSSMGGKVVSDIFQKQGSSIRTAVIPVKSGQGGVSIVNLTKGTQNYDNLLKDIKKVSGLYQSIGKIPKIPAFSYVQGEAELENSVDYKGLLTQIQIDLDTDIKAITGQSEDVYCCLYNLSYLNSTNETTKNSFAFNQMRVAKAQYELVRDNSKFLASTPTYAITYNSNDAIHLSNIGQNQLGVYQGDAISKLLNGIAKKGTYVGSHSIATNTITLNVLATEFPLVIDTSLIPARTNYGFSVINSSNVDLISSVSVNNSSGVITITCSSSPIGAKIRYGCGGTVNVYGGNIRDSSANRLSKVIVGNIHSFNDWLQMFEIQL